MKPTEDLVDEHKAIKIMLSIMDNISNRLEAGKHVNPQHLEKILEFLRIFADKCHHGKEEDLLFPVLVEAGIPRESAPIAVMLNEHKIGRDYIKNMADNFVKYKRGDSSSSSKIIKNIREYTRLLTQHIDKEDTILYPMADHQLSDEKQKELLKRFEDIEKNVIGEGKHEDFHKLLLHLKNEYI